VSLTILRRFAPRIVPNSSQLLDSSTKKLQCALLLKFKSHYVQQMSVRCASEIWVSLKKILTTYMDIGIYTYMDIGIYILKYIY